MTISTRGFKKVERGLRYDPRTKRAVFDLWSSGPNRRRHRKTAIYESVDDARLHFLEFRLRVLGRRPAATEPVAVSLSQYLRVYADSIWSDTSPSTYKQNRWVAENYLVAFFGDRLLPEIDEVGVADFKAWCRRRTAKDGTPRPLANATINHALRRLRECLRHAHLRRLTTAVPRVTLLREVELHNELTPEEEDAFLAAFDDAVGYRKYLRAQGRSTREVTSGFDGFRSSRPLFLAALHTGLRKSDLLHLRWSSVRSAERMILVAVKKTGRLATIPISAPLQQVLNDARDARHPSDTDFVFTTKSGVRFADSVVRRYFAIAKWIAGIHRRFRIHDLRHTFASTLTSAGYDLTVVQRCLGHATVHQTLRYARPNQLVFDAVRVTLGTPRRELFNRGTSEDQRQNLEPSSETPAGHPGANAHVTADRDGAVRR